MSELTAGMVEREHGVALPGRARPLRIAENPRAVPGKKASSREFERSFDDQLIRAFAENHARASIIVLALAAIVSAVSSFWFPIGLAGIWFVAVSAILAVRHLCAERFMQLDPDATTLPGWRRLFTAIEFAFACAWAPAVNLLALSERGSYGLTLFVALTGAAVGTMLSASIPPAVLAGIVPLGLSVGLVPLLSPGPAASMLAVMFTGALAFLVILGRRLHEGAIEGIRARTEKDQMVLELEEAKANSDEARRRAEEASLAKSRFLATMSHELRTPLNAIMGFSEVMKDEVFGAHAFASYRDYSNDIHDSGRHLLNLIDEILDLSRIEAGRYELAQETLQLSRIVSEARHMLGLRAKAKSQVVREVVDTSLPTLWADERAVRQIVLNVLSNAIKFTPPGGEIVVKVGWTASGGQYVSVKDNGPGIPEEEIPVVMSSFGRGSLAIKTAEQGSGLGLPIVKGLVDLHGGAFHIRSGHRAGTEAIVTFPAARVMDTPSSDPPGEPAHASSRVENGTADHRMV